MRQMKGALSRCCLLHARLVMPMLMPLMVMVMLTSLLMLLLLVAGWSSGSQSLKRSFKQRARRCRYAARQRRLVALTPRF